MAIKIMILAGGTGGHVFPGLAVAEHLLTQGHQVFWMGTQGRLEARVVPKAGIIMDWLSVSGIRGKGWLVKLFAPFMLVKACWQARRILSQRKPDVVLGMGGFVAGPGGLMAKLLGIPLVIHEQNSVPGMTNRIIAHFATQSLEAFQGSFDSSIRAQCVGNPLRKAINGRKVGLDLRKPVCILIIGGSLGAKVLNDIVPKTIADLLPEPVIWHQTGRAMEVAVHDSYEALHINARVEVFIDNMAEAYQWADLVICRSGAITVSELVAMGLPSILVPYPYAVDDHQTKNARYLSDSGAAILMSQDKFTVDHLAEILKKLLQNRAEINAMGQAASALARPDAAARVAAICLQVVR